MNPIFAASLSTIGSLDCLKLKDTVLFVDLYSRLFYFYVEESMIVNMLVVTKFMNISSFLNEMIGISGRRNIKI